MKLREDSRWVKKVKINSLDKIKVNYAEQFPSTTGNVAKPLQKNMFPKNGVLKLALLQTLKIGLWSYRVNAELYGIILA